MLYRGDENLKLWADASFLKGAFGYNNYIKAVHEVRDLTDTFGELRSAREEEQSHEIATDLLHHLPTPGEVQLWLRYMAGDIPRPKGKRKRATNYDAARALEADAYKHAFLRLIRVVLGKAGVEADCKARAEKAAKSTHWTTQYENHIEAGWTSRHEAMEALDIEWMLDGIDKMDQDSEGLDHFLANTESEIDEGFAEDLPEEPLSEFA